VSAPLPLSIIMPAEPSRSQRAFVFLRHVLFSGAFSAAEIEKQTPANHLLGARIDTDKAFRLSTNEGGRT
jgi:hypothetical protein